MNNTIGIYYETPDGRIAYTYGWDGKRKQVWYHFDAGAGQIANEEEFQTWKPRNDLRDFPNSTDPRLPRVFDLFWDLKRMSDLNHALRYGHDDMEAIQEAMKEHGIKL